MVFNSPNPPQPGLYSRSSPSPPLAPVRQALPSESAPSGQGTQHRLPGASLPGKRDEPPYSRCGPGWEKQAARWGVSAARGRPLPHTGSEPSTASGPAGRPVHLPPPTGGRRGGARPELWLLPRGEGTEAAGGPAAEGHQDVRGRGGAGAPLRRPPTEARPGRLRPPSRQQVTGSQKSRPRGRDKHSGEAQPGDPPTTWGDELRGGTASGPNDPESQQRAGAGATGFGAKKRRCAGGEGLGRRTQTSTKRGTVLVRGCPVSVDRGRTGWRSRAWSGAARPPAGNPINRTQGRQAPPRAWPRSRGPDGAGR